MFFVPIVSATDVRCKFKSELDKTSINELEQQAKEGNPRSQFLMYYAYREGFYGEKDLEKARYWLLVASDKDPDAQIFVAKNLESRKLYSEAYKWYGKAAELQNSYAYYMMGVYRSYEQYGMIDLRKSVQLFEKAVSLGGVAGAYTQIGIAYVYGAGVSEDVSKGLEILLHGALKGDPEAYRLLSKLYAEGEIVTKDMSLSEEYQKKYEVLLSTRKAAECDFERVSSAKAAANQGLNALATLAGTVRSASRPLAKR